MTIRTNKGFSTVTLNTTGMTFIAVFISSYGAKTVSDSKSNTWDTTIAGVNTSAGAYSKWSFVKNPTTDSAHVFNVVSAAASAVIFVFATDEVDVSGTVVLDSSTANSNTATSSLALPALSPVSAAFVLAGIAHTADAASTSAYSASNSFTTVSQSGTSGSTLGGAIAYLNVAASTIGTTLSWTGANPTSGAIVAFKALSGPGDTTAPTLTSPTGASTGSTTASGGATTDEANGTFYTVWTVAATAPTAAQVEAGQNSSGATAAASANQAVTSTGAKTNNATGLTPSTTYYAQSMHKDAAGNRSNVVTSASFTTSAGGDTTAPTLTSPTGTATGSTTASGTVSTDEANGTLYRYASTNATETAATVKAAALTQTVTATGSQSVSFTGLTASTTYYAHYVHRDAAGNDSTVANSASFTTSALATATVAPIIKNNTGSLLTSLLVPKVAVLKLSDMSTALTLTNQTTHSSTAALSITSASLVAGTDYLVVGSDATGANAGVEKVTAA